jgi:hypothetical protein
MYFRIVSHLSTGCGGSLGSLRMKDYMHPESLGQLCVDYPFQFNNFFVSLT